MKLKAVRIVHWQVWLLFLMISTLIQGQLKAKPLQLDCDTIIMGGGCFWCIEPIMESLDGVMNATSGYAGGTSKAPTYKSICSGKTGHAEVAKIEFNKEKRHLIGDHIFAEENIYWSINSKQETLVPKTFSFELKKPK